MGKKTIPLVKYEYGKRKILGEVVIDVVDGKEDYFTEAVVDPRTVLSRAAGMYLRAQEA